MPIDTGARSGGRAASRIAPTSRRTARAPAARTYRTSLRPSNVSVSPQTERATTKAPAALARVRAAARTFRSVSGLDPVQQHVLQTLLSEGQRTGASKSDKLSAVETGLVESNLSNPSGGDGSSVGWRQETASSYPGVNRMNVKGGADRFYSELKSAPQGSPGQRAQAVQRSAYPARYDQEAGQAKSLIKASASQPNPKDVRILQKAGIETGPQRSSASKRYTNPFPSKAWQQSRTDQGVDFAPKTANAPIRAIGNATYVGKGEGPAWASGGGGGTGDGLLYKLHNSKGLPSPYIFVYEGVRSDPHLKPGQTIKRGQIIGQGVQGGSLESGYADSSGTPISHATYHEGDVTRGGTQFQNLLAKLPGSSATKGNIGSFVSTGGGGTSGAAGFAAAAGVSVAQAKKMTPRERRLAIQKKLGQIRSLGGTASGTDIPTASLSRSVASRSQSHGATLPHHSLGL